MVETICMGFLELQEAKTENCKMKNSYPQRDLNSLVLDKGSLEKDMAAISSGI